MTPEQTIQHNPDNECDDIFNKINYQRGLFVRALSAHDHPGDPDFADLARTGAHVEELRHGIRILDQRCGTSYQQALQSEATQARAALIDEPDSSRLQYIANGPETWQRFKQIHLQPGTTVEHHDDAGINVKKCQHTADCPVFNRPSFTPGSKPEYCPVNGTGISSFPSQKLDAHGCFTVRSGTIAAVSMDETYNRDIVDL